MDKYQEAFVENLKYYRKQMGLSQEQLAEKCGISTSSIACYESFHQNPSFDQIIKLSNALSIHPADLFMRDASKIQNQDLFRKYQELIQYCEQIPEYQQTSVKHLAKSLAEQPSEYAPSHK